MASKPAFHMSPPLVGRPTTRRPAGARKIAIPGWVALPLFRVLRHGKLLRGTVAGPVRLPGRAAAGDGRLIGQYIADLRTVMAALTAANMDTAVALAELPDQIRGFGPVKDANRAKAEAQRTQLLEALSRPPALAVAAE